MGLVFKALEFLVLSVKGFNGYDVLILLSFLAACALLVKFDNMKWKKGFRL